MRTIRVVWLIIGVSAIPACGSWRIAGYLDELESSTGSGETSDPDDTTDAAESTSTVEASTSGEGTAETTDDPATTGTGAETNADSGTDDGTSTTETTLGPLAECGNGVVEDFPSPPEECDDGNTIPDDGCSDTCALDRRAFVTSIRYKAGELQSLYLADAICANRAADANLADPLKYRAWLSDSTTNARDRFVRGRGRLVLVNDLVLARSWSALLEGELENAFEVTEKGEIYHGRVWTGTRPDGTGVPAAGFCEDWGSDSFLKTGHYGYSDRTTPEWTLSESDDNPTQCPSNNALYCVQNI